MAKVLFQAKVTLNSATDLGSNTWSISVDFSDALGVFTASDAQVGDVIVFDTAASGEFGTYTRFIILSIDNVTGSTITASVQYDPTNNNDTPPDLTWIIGLGSALITRPTATHGLLPTPSTGVHGMTDDFAEYVSNMNLESIDAMIVSADLSSTSIDALSDVDTTTVAPTNGQGLVWDGTNWTPQTLTGGDLSNYYTKAEADEMALVYAIALS